MQVGNELKSLSPFQKEIANALQKIAALGPDNWTVVSETALVIAATKDFETKACRDTYRTAFELIADRGFARREGTCWIFKKRFTPADATALITWSGTFTIDRNATRTYGK